MVESAAGDVLVVTTSAASAERRKALETRGVRVEIIDGAGRPHGSACGVVQLLAKEQYLSLMIEAGSKVNWAALETGVVDKIFFYYAPKILGGLTVAAGGRRRGASRGAGCDCCFTT